MDEHSVEDTALVVETEEELIDLEKVPVRVSIGSKAPAEHRRITNKLGLAGSTKLLTVELAEWLKKNGYSAYPIESVDKYMRSKVREAGRSGIAWRWVPLRKLQARAVKDGGYSNEHFYENTVPVEVLMTVEKIFNHFGDQVVFEVTDVYSRPSRRSIDADPFLAVRAPGGQRFILERWDEPGYRT